MDLILILLDRLTAIIEKLNQTYPGINVKLSEVFLKLDIANKEIKISTKEPKLINNNDLLQLSEINLRLDFISLIKKEKSIRNLQILSKKNPLKD